MDSYAETGHQAGQVDVARGEHVQLLEAGYGGRLHQGVRVVLHDGTAHQARRADGGDGGTVPWRDKTLKG